MSEHIEQVRFVSWFRKEYPQHKIYAIPNGGNRSRREGAKLKAEGVLAGVHDLHVPSLKLWIEMKKDGRGKASPKQKEWGTYIESIGHSWILGLGFEDAKAKVIQALEQE